jgi:hypothetical protein
VRKYKEVEPILILGAPRAERAARRIKKLIDIPKKVAERIRMRAGRIMDKMLAAKIQIVKMPLHTTDTATRRLLSKIEERYHLYLRNALSNSRGMMASPIIHANAASRLDP